GRLRASGAAGAVVYSGIETVDPITTPDADAGGSYTIDEGDPVTLDASATDRGGRQVTYAWDLNGDGFFGDVSGETPLVTWSQLRALGVDDGPETYTIGVRVTNDLGASSDAFATLTIANTAPDIDASGAATVVAGQPYTLTL